MQKASKRPKLLASGHSDIFQTEAFPVERLLPFIPPEWIILEPACGEGRIVDTLRADGRNVIATDIDRGFDFLTPMGLPQEPFNCIITNPPYSIKDKWLQRCFDIGKPFALILPCNALGEQNRYDMYKKYGIQIALYRERVNFGTPSGGKSSAWFPTCWFCWGMPLPAPITFLA